MACSCRDGKTEQHQRILSLVAIGSVTDELADSIMVAVHMEDMLKKKTRMSDSGGRLAIIKQPAL